jgi:acid phosphatase type 7
LAVRQLTVAVVLLTAVLGAGLLAYLLLVVPRENPDGSTGGDPTASPFAVQGVMVGAGDIAQCPTDDDEATASLLDDVVREYSEAIVFTTGDNVYPDGAYREFVDCYDPSWGRHKERTRPAVGNHDFRQTKAEGYHQYWGDQGGEFDRYYYSYDIADWHVVVLNSGCHRVGCELGSEDGEQAEWLVQDLEESGARCTVAVWHHPRWSSGRYENNPDYSGFWEILHDHGAEIVLNGHEHFYERFEPMNAEGNRDDAGGIRQFTIGTGGGELREPESVEANSVVRLAKHGVLKLTLGDGRYEWDFLSVDGSVPDRGSGVCH